ncbi:MAG: hypothetical protein K2U26_15820 [Cyclobacteriaceae bacterium]|nr:hypothetical protein [Cyclobacteriaceae bacterium]
MEYIKLLAGVALVLVFAWLLIRNAKRSGFLHSMLRVDTLLGMIAGLYLVFSSAQSLLL